MKVYTFSGKFGVEEMQPHKENSLSLSFFPAELLIDETTLNCNKTQSGKGVLPEVFLSKFPERVCYY